MTIGHFFHVMEDDLLSFTELGWLEVGRRPFAGDSRVSVSIFWPGEGPPKLPEQVQLP